MVACANCVTRIQQRFRQAELRGHVGGRDVDHPAQIFAPPRAIQLRQRIERFQVIRRRVSRRLQNPVRVLRPAGQPKQRRLKQAHVGVVGRELHRTIDLARGVLIPAHSEIDQTEVGMAGRFIGCQLDQLRELSLGVFEPVVFQVCQAQRPGGENGAGVGGILLASPMATECECRERCKDRNRTKRAVHGSEKLTPHCGAGYCLRHVLASFHGDRGIRRRDRCRRRTERSRCRQRRRASQHRAE